LTVLIDTNVLREVWHPKGHAAAKAAVASLDPAETFLSVITIGEVARGILELPQGAKRLSLSLYLSSTESGFGDRILPVTCEIAHRWGEMTANARRQGFALPPTDGLIAATALHHGLAVMTRNVRDFAATGVTVIDPWKG
jgi:toxin FitB